MEKDLILIKLGGSVITDKTKPYTPQYDTIKQLAKQIHIFHEQNQDINIIVGHGGGSFPHRSATEYQTQKGFINEKSICGLAVVQNDAAKLNRIIVQALLDAGENAISMQPSSFCIAENDKIVESYTKPIEKALENNMIPVPYGDAVIDRAKGCCILSTEEILYYLAEKFNGKKVIQASKTPVLDNNKNMIKEITKSNFNSIRSTLSGSDTADVTGGMLLKVEMALKSTESKIETHIIDGKQAGNLLKALKGEYIGTKIY